MQNSNFQKHHGLQHQSCHHGTFPNRFFRNLGLGILLLTGWLISSHLLAEELNVNPGINDHYLADPDYRQWVRMFESPGREVFDQRKAVIEEKSRTGGK